MDFASALPYTFLADASAASNVMRGYITPAIVTLCTLASLACTFFLVNGGIQYMTSSGKPDKLEQAKKTIKGALLGLAVVLAAATVTTILSHAYTASNNTSTKELPELAYIEPKEVTNPVVATLIDAATGMLRSVAQMVGTPFVQALSHFTTHTPLMGENSSVFNIWLAVVGITDVIFILVVALLGFQIMSFSTLGFEEIDIRQLLPQFALVFLLINTSIFAIDAIIGLSNAMIKAMQAGFHYDKIWDTLIEITRQTTEVGLAGALILVAFLVLTLILLVYYVGRLITLYVGAILSPLIILLWLLPAFKDFAITAAKTYLTTIFVLFVHVVILLLAAAVFTGVSQGNTAEGQPNLLMSLIVGLATVVALLKTQGVMQELSYAASGPRASRELASSFMRGAAYTKQAIKAPYDVTKGGIKAYQGVKKWQDKHTKKKQESNDDRADDKGHKTPAQTGLTISSRPPKTGETVKVEKAAKK